MIKRYTSDVMKEIWSEEARFEKMLEVELACLEGYVQENIIPLKDFELIKEKAYVDVFRIDEIEQTTKHDVMAFTKAVCEKMGDEKKWFHFGLTSTDIVDTAQSLQIKLSNEIILKRIDTLLETLKKLAIKYKNTLCIGRTHGQHAEVTSFGLKFLGAFDELNRAKSRLIEERCNIEVVKISGAVGNFSDISYKIEDFVQKKLGLNPSTISTQVLSRDRHTGYLNSLAMVSNAIEHLALELRHLARTEIGEVSEGFSKNQTGSSVMPHKKNPISCENMCGLARVIRSYVNVGYEDTLLWDERDISHSSAERIILPDACSLTEYMLNRFNNVLLNLNVNENKMLENIALSKGVVYSPKLLIKLVSKGIERNEAYDLLQGLSFQAINENKEFLDVVMNSKISTILSKDEIIEAFNPQNALKNIDVIYKKVLTPKAKTLVVLGSGWGDEGKGKITNYLSERSNMVVRFQGGNNAGHTIKFNGKTFKLHLIPSGIFDENIKNVLGNGMAINPLALMEELNTIKEEGFKCNNLFISDRAQVIFNYHIELDRLNEIKLASRKIGTTLKGIGPAYTDKVSRQGIRMVDFVSDSFEEIFKLTAALKNEEIIALGGTPIDIDQSLKLYNEIREVIKPMVCDTISLINESYKNNEKILFEGAQGSLLDIDFGTYPYVTSSNPSSGGVATGTGFSPNKIDEVLAIVKAYSTRVGSGAFPTEFEDELAHEIREKANEYGATTKRPRRIGWLDGVALKYSTTVNGFTSISLMLLDILSGIPRIKICTAYNLDGKIITTIPASLKEFEKCVPIYEEFDGWNENISQVKSFDELPLNAQKYIEAIERITNVKVSIFSVGPDKTQTIVREERY